MKTIDSLDKLDIKEFYNSYFNQKPVIIKGGIENTKFFKRWSMNYLKQKIGNRPVTLNYASSQLYNNAISEVKNLEGSFHEMIDRLVSGGVDTGSYYLAQSSIEQNFPELLEDLEMPKYIKESDLLLSTNMWLGGSGCDSGLHYDFSHNFFLQVIGKKELTLFAPEDSKYLYPSDKEGFKHMSEIALNDVNLIQFPMFNKAKPLIIMVEAGDCVYIPSYWWHNLISIELSLSVNYWWVTFDVPTSPRAKLVSTPLLTQLIQGFLNKGYRIDHITEDGELLLIKAIAEGFTNIVEAMLLLGADVNSKSLKLIPDGTALYTAVEFNRPDIVKLLLKHGAQDTPLNGKTASDLAKEIGSLIKFF